MADNSALVRALYQKLLTLYPPAFREKFAESMAQTFNDLYTERRQQPGQGLFGFVLYLFYETAIAISKEHMLRIRQGDRMTNITTNARAAALIGFLLTLPFMLLNTIASNQIEPLATLFKINTAGGFWDHPIGHISASIALLLLPCGAVIAMRPMFQKGAAGKRKFYWLNILLALLLLGLFVLIAGALLEEIYRCNVLQIPNCD